MILAIVGVFALIIFIIGITRDINRNIESKRILNEINEDNIKREKDFERKLHLSNLQSKRLFQRK